MKQLKNNHYSYSPFSQEYIEQQRSEMYRAMAKCETPEQVEKVRKAFYATVYPYQH